MRRIVVGLDQSPRGAVVFNTALEIARSSGAKLDVVRAVPLPVEFPMEALSISPDALPGRLLEHAQKQLEKTVAGAPKEVLDKVESQIGTPWQVVCDFAKERNADMIVVGTHGYSGLDRILGTTAAKIVNHAHCSVLVVRGNAE